MSLAEMSLGLKHVCVRVCVATVLSRANHTLTSKKKQKKMSVSFKFQLCLISRD